METINEYEDSTSIEMLALALVREYLSRKDYRHTLNLFDKESKKKDASIQNRRKLAERLNIIYLVKKNKEEGVRTLKTFLEMVVRNLKDSQNEVASESSRQYPVSTKATQKNASTSDSVIENYDGRITPIFTPDGRNSPVSSPRNRNTKIPRYTYNNRKSKENNSTPSGIYVENRHPDHVVVQNSLEENLDMFVHASRKKKSPSYSVQPVSGVPTKNVSKLRNKSPLICNSDSTQKSNNKVENFSLDKHLAPLPTNDHPPSMSVRNSSNEILQLDDVDFTDQKIDNNNNKNWTNTSNNIRSKPISLKIAIQLKSLLFGLSNGNFNQEWKIQGFKFSTHPLLRYGLVQDKGGPCGLLACVQAVVLKQWLFKDRLVNATIVQPSEKEQQELLIESFVEILWKARCTSDVIMALTTPNVKFSSTSKCKHDGVTEKLQLFHFDTTINLRGFLLKNISSFTKNNGCVLFLYAVILTAGVENIINSMDEANATLIGRHGYCTQEMVNLLLTGKAVSNVFDGVVELTSNGAEKSVLHGISNRSNIGFLSLFEHFDSCKVGNHYKVPHYPVWVVCSESHFSVLFSLVDINNHERRQFDMYYYDGLANQDEEIKLTISLGSGRRESSPRTSDLTPPLEHCIRTRWKNARVSWNETEPIL